MKLTSNELKVLKAIDRSEYGTWLVDETWTFSMSMSNRRLRKRMGRCVLSDRDSLVAGRPTGAHLVTRDTAIGSALLLDARGRHVSPCAFPAM